MGAVSLVTLPVGSSFACAFRRLLGPVCLFLQNSRNSSSALTSLIRSSRRGSDPPLSFEGLFERVVVEKLRHPIGQDDFEPLLGLPTGYDSSPSSPESYEGSHGMHSDEVKSLFAS